MLPNQIEVITLFAEDLAGAMDFYRKVFSPEIIFEDEGSAVLGFSGTMINLLAAPQAPMLVEPAPIGPPGAGPRLLLTIRVDNVDEVCRSLAQIGVQLLNGPIDRPWGRRTAAFLDPAGNAWEVAQIIA